MIEEVAAYWASRMMGGGIQFDFYELRQVGMVAAYEALERWEPDRGALKTFISSRVRFGIVDAIRELDWVPRLVRRKRAAIDGAYRRLWHREARPVTDEALAAELGLGDAEYLEQRRKNRLIESLSLDEVTAQGDARDQTAIELVPDDVEMPGEREEREEFWRQATRGLRQNERAIVVWYYRGQMSMKEIAEQLGVSESRVSQLHTRLLPRLRGRCESLREAV